MILNQRSVALPGNVHTCMCHEPHAQFIFASFLGADEDIESPELTTSRPTPKISFTSAVPKVETMTLKTQRVTPAQTKVPLLGVALACTCGYCFLLTAQNSPFESPPPEIMWGQTGLPFYCCKRLSAL